MFFCFWKAKSFFSKRNALHHKNHITGKNTHYLTAFIINLRLSRFPTINIVPVLARSNRHVRKREKLVQFIKSSGTAGTSCTYNACSNLKALIKRCLEILPFVGLAYLSAKTISIL